MLSVLKPWRQPGANSCNMTMIEATDFDLEDGFWLTVDDEQMMLDDDERWWILVKDIR